MSLLSALGLAAVRAGSPVAATTGAMPVRPPQAAPARGRVVAGEPEVKPRRTRMTSLTVAGRKNDLWGLLDVDGVVVQGGGPAPLDTLAALNRGAAELWRLNEQTLLVRVPLWRKAVADVQATAARAAAELKKHAGAKRAVTKGRDRGGDFFEDVNGYLKAAGLARTLAGEIHSAQIAYEKSLADLETALSFRSFEEAKDDVEAKKAALEKKKAELEEAQQIFATVLDIGKKVISADWKGLADQAIGAIKDKAQDAVRDAILGPLFDVDIRKLTAALETAEKQMADAKAQWLASSVNAATLGMRKAASDFDNARSRLGEQLQDLARNQGNAVAALKRDPATRPLGQLIGERGRQLTAIGAARDVVHSFVRVADAVAQQARAQQNGYARLPSELSRLPEEGGAYRRHSAWAREAAWVAAANGLLMIKLLDAANALKSDALQALGYLGSDGERGPMGPFDQAIQSVDEALAA